MIRYRVGLAIGRRTIAAVSSNQGTSHGKACYSTVFEQPAAEVWKIIRDFNNYSIWVQGEGLSEIEDGKSGDTVGAVRSVHFRGMHIRQRLLAHSDVERSQTYEFCGAPARR